MPTAARRAAVKARAAANEKPRPPGTAPHDFPIWDGQRGVWTNAAGGASPSTAVVQHRHDKRKVVRQKERRADRAKAADPSRPRGSAPHDFPIWDGRRGVWTNAAGESPGIADVQHALLRRARQRVQLELGRVGERSLRVHIPQRLLTLRFRAHVLRRKCRCKVVQRPAEEVEPILDARNASCSASDGEPGKSLASRTRNALSSSSSATEAPK